MKWKHESCYIPWLSAYKKKFLINLITDSKITEIEFVRER